MTSGFLTRWSNRRIVSKRVSRDSSRDLASPWSSEAAERYLDQSRWLADWQWRRGDAYERKASQVLGFAAIVLVLLPTLIKPVSAIVDIGARDRAQAVLVAATALLVVSIAFSLMSLRRRPVSGFDPAVVERQWSRYQREGRPAGHVSADFVEVLIAGSETQPGVLKSLTDDARTRGKWFHYSCVTLGLAAVLLATLFVMILDGGN
jgi:hypothetical protein